MDIDAITYRIPSFNMPWLTKKISQLNTRALKLNMPPLMLNVRKEVVEHQASDAFKYSFVTIEGTPPVINGWEFTATISKLNDTNILRVRPGLSKEIPPAYWDAEIWCDHCDKFRTRNNSYILYNAVADEWQQVGKQCIKDFLPHCDPEMLAEFASQDTAIQKLIGDLEQGMPELKAGCRDEGYMGLESYLKIVAFCIERYGWVSRSDVAEKTPTADKALSLIDDLKKKDKISMRPTQAHTALAQRVIEWLKQLDDELIFAEENASFLKNLKTMAEQGCLTYNMTGFAAAMIPAYHRAHAVQQGEYVGRIAERRTFYVKCTRKREMDGQYGMTLFHEFEDQDGNCLVWFASGELAPDIPLDTMIVIKATPKKHDEYNKKKQTRVTRVVVMHEDWLN